MQAVFSPGAIGNLLESNFFFRTYQILEFPERQILENIIEFPERQILKFANRFAISPQFGWGVRSREVGGGHDRSGIQHTKF